MRTSAAFIISLVCLAFPLAASAASVTITMTDDLFTPKSVTINAGDTVTWINNGTMAHTVTADDGSFDSGSIPPEGTLSHTFATTETFSYHCAFHGAAGGIGMSGVVTVVAAPVAPAPTQTTTTTTANTTTSASAQPYSIAPLAPAPSNAIVPGQSSSVTPSSSGGSAIASLQAEAQALTLYLAQLLQQHGGSSASASGSACSAITAMSPGASGTGVSELQSFLARDPSVYPDALVTGYYGSLTTAAVQAFQAKNGIVSSGDPASTGYGAVGPHTLAAIQAECTPASTGTSAPAAPINSDNVGGFIQVSPVSGNSPLQVTVEANVNTTNDCGASLYTLDFGDGSAPQTINVPAGTCATAQQSYTHTYTATGNYGVVLSAGQHSSTATVVVQ